MTELATVLDRHVRLFNQGVRSGDFGPMISHFAQDADMVFEGVPVGPFKGRVAIARAYSENPPDDEVILLKVSEQRGENIVNGVYAWSKNPKVRAGEFRIVTRGDMINQITIRYER